jgi:Fur family transcriptional regulator, ferric uptake regulator
VKKELLRKKVKGSGLKDTPLREEVLQLFINSNKALSSKEIIKKLGNKYDRVSIFRTISSFSEKGIIHSIPTSSDYVVYSLCRDECQLSNHQDNHYHFWCHKCGNIFCLNDFEFEKSKLPKGYKTQRVNIIFEGICKDCNKN